MNHKSICEFNATDFNADKIKLYEQIRQMMAAKYGTEGYFGPPVKTGPEKNVKDMSKEEYKAYKKNHDKEIEMIRTGYNRIKEKVKNVRQDFSKAVVSGTRSGSGKIVLAYYNDLKTIWGGSPSTEALTFGVESQSFHSQSEDNETDTPSTSDGSLILSSECQASTDSLQSLALSNGSRRCSTPVEDESETVDYSETLSEKNGKLERQLKRKSESVSNVPKLIDNKRKHLEKRLTAAQRDQKLLQSAKEDICLRKEMMDCFRESTTTTAKAIEQMSQTMKGISEGIVQGMALLANALAAPRHPYFQHPVQPHYHQQAGPGSYHCEGFYQPMQTSVETVVNSQRDPSEKENTYFELS